MNRILFEKSEIMPDGIVHVADRRAAHMRSVLHSVPGDTVRVGVLDGMAGDAVVEFVTDDEITLRVITEYNAPQPWFDMLLAVPRPKVLHRLWAELAAIGVGRIILINASRVERCYFDTHWLSPESWTPLLIEGLEQSGATIIPEVIVKRAFKPFIEDELPALYGDAPKFVAHPRLDRDGDLITLPLQPKCDAARPLLAIGPEGGWSAFELDKLFSSGFQPLTLGDRALRTDTACVALAGALMGAETAKRQTL